MNLLIYGHSLIGCIFVALSVNSAVIIVCCTLVTSLLWVRMLGGIARYVSEFL